MSGPRGGQLARRIDALTIADRAALKRLRAALERRKTQGKPVTKLEAKLEAGLAAAERLMAVRRATPLKLDVPEQLPIAAAAERIHAALEAHAVVVVCGDTGSGKTTQLPKLCLAAGRGLRGAIAHTQPRRIAARAVARRLAEELGVELGSAVGLKVRFTDESSRASLVKVMTDGILLNEIRADRKLEAYDTIIIDEAHERSLNIDFLLGYLRRLLERRRDLKLIITSATIDPERFATHFGGAPIVHVEGRSFPVAYRYRPRERGEDLADAVVAAARELAALPAEEGGGGKHRDMLVFLPGERWIRDAARALERERPNGYEVLPLYARLTTHQQQRIFKPGPAPRIVLATNIAETSLTVPRIRYVIDSGLARISRYAARHRVQGLGVEPIAQANAQQRAGRCGRLAPGICVRLYSETDFEARPAFTEPEILRTDLAGVILRLAALGVGAVDEFPFVDAPPTKAVNDAYRLLYVLGAMSTERALSADGELMARLPLDPRLAKLLLAAQARGALSEALVLASALSVVDPREYPAEKLEAARASHAEQGDARSDFVSYLNLWRAYQRERRRGQKSFRAWSAAHFLSLARLREWDDVHAQLAELVRSFGWSPVRHRDDYKTLHQIVLAAFVDFVAERGDAGLYRGMHEARAALFPGSPLAAKRPRWVVAAEHVATERAYLRTVAQINPRWIMDVAPHLLKREHSDPHWDAERGRVTAREIVSIFGLVLSSERRVDFGRIDAPRAREIFIAEALVADALGLALPFLEHNRRARARVLEWEARLRARDLFIGERAFERRYDEVLPHWVRDRRSVREFCLKRAQAARLEVEADELSSRSLAQLPEAAHPLTLEVAGQALALRYHYEPGSEVDGITLEVPAVLLAALPVERLEWLVPGWLEEKVRALLRSLPKELRRPLVPIPDTARALMPSLEHRFGQQTLIAALCEVLLEQRGAAVPAAAFDASLLEAYLFMRIEVLDEQGRVIAARRDARALQIELGDEHGALGRAAAVVDPGWTRSGLTAWDCGVLPERVTVERYSSRLELYPALVDEGGRVDLRLLPPGPPAEHSHRLGVRRLLIKGLPQQAAWLRDRVRGDAALQLGLHGVAGSDELVDDLLAAAADESFALDAPIRDAAAFERCFDAGRADFVPVAERLLGRVQELLVKLRELRKHMDALGPRLGDEARDDIKAQLEELVGPYFMSRAPVSWRVHLPRYLDAIEARLDAWPERRAKDADYQRMVARAWTRYASWRAAQPAGWPEPQALTQYRWMVEEFRVSLFAQRLGTALPISEKRLEQAWEKIWARGQTLTGGQTPLGV